MKGRRFRCLFLWVPLTFLLWAPLSRAQTSPLNVSITSISIEDSTVYRGLHAGFPWPVMTLITIQDSIGRYVHGLADTTRWLLPGDTTEVGLPVNQVWQNLLEYHSPADTLPVTIAAGDTLPGDTNIKHMIPDYQVTEVYDVEGLGLSSALVMDYSGSLQDDIYTSEDAARIFIRQMSKNDQTAIIKFTGKVEVFQNFTSDTTMLMDAIGRSNDNRLYTALYDAVYTGVELQRTQSSLRKPVVVYTDGQDNYSSHSVDDVISLAQELSTPLFTIGLGPDIDENDLQRMANETGGTYWHATTVDSLAQIYVAIYRLIRGYYVMAHQSTDPYYNGSWRLVDITLNDGDREGQGKGLYYVPFKPSDFILSKTAQTDSSTGSGANVSHFLETDGQVSYSIDLVNQGPSASPQVVVYDVPPPELELISADPSPADIQADTLVWTFGHMEPGDSKQINLLFSIDTLHINDAYTLTNVAWASSSQDTIDHNDRDSVDVIYLPLTPVDLAIAKYALTDSMSVIENDTTYYAGEDEIVNYKISVVNTGQEAAGLMTFVDLLPENVTWVSGPTDDAALSGDTLRWTLASLGSRGASHQFAYTVRTDADLPPWVVPQNNTVTVSCEDDHRLSNNTASDDFMALGPISPDPLVRCNPLRIEPLDSVTIEVFTPVHAVRWDLLIEFEDGSSIDYYADSFINATVLTPGVWTQVIPDFAETEMRTYQVEEQVQVIFETEDVWQVVKQDTCWFTISSADAYYLDENEWHPEMGDLGMRFQLSSNRMAEIIIYDISGAHVRLLYDGPANAGWNRTIWDGLDDNGTAMGSGLYVAVLRAGNFQKYRKFMLVR